MQVSPPPLHPPPLPLHLFSRPCSRSQSYAANLAVGSASSSLSPDDLHLWLAKVEKRRKKPLTRTAARLLKCRIKQIEVAVKWNSETFRQVQGALLSSVRAAGGVASQSASRQEIPEVGASSWGLFALNHVATEVSLFLPGFTEQLYD